MESEVSNKADFSLIKYSQCWEDTNLVLQALSIKESDICLSIAAAGDNTLSLLSKNPKKVIALDLNFCQIALLKLKVHAMQVLSYDEFVTLLGYDQSIEKRQALYLKIKNGLEPDVERYWTNNAYLIEKGIADSGRLESYFRIFRKGVLPLIHSENTITQLFSPKSRQKRAGFYENRWNSLRWKIIASLFFSRYSLQKLGRDKSFFQYADHSLSKQIACHLTDALVCQEPWRNPYLHWILSGRYDFEKNIVPYFLDRKNYALIKANLHKLEIKQDSLEGFLSSYSGPCIDAFNLSDIFEYMSENNFLNCLSLIVSKANNGARLAYFNMLAQRDAAGKDIEKCPLNLSNQTFFYSRFIAERIKKEAA